MGEPAPDGPTRDLAASPSLLPMFARAALETAVAPALRLVGAERHGDTLPERVLTRRGVRIPTAHLAAYDRVCGYPLGPTLPLTYPHLLAFPLSVAVMTGGGFPLPLVGLVHVANRIDAHRAIGVEEALDVRVHAADLREHRAGRQVDLVAEVSVAGDPVWSSTSTYLHRTRSGGREGGGGGDGGRGGDRAARPEPAPGWALRVPGDIGRRYAAVSGDRNPIHRHPLSARLFGFPRAIAHGMWLAARLAASLSGRLPAAVRYDVEFKAPLLIPATVEVVTTAVPPGGWDLAVHDPRSGRPHLSGSLRPADG